MQDIYGQEFPLRNGWEEISGDWKDEGNIIVHEGIKDGGIIDRLYINNIRASDGYIKGKIKVLNEIKGESQAQLVFRYVDAQRYYFAGIGGWYKKFTIGKRVPQGYFGLVVQGEQKEVELGRSFDVKVNFMGTKIELFLGEVKICEINDNNSPYLHGNVGLRTWNQNKAIFEDVVLYRKQARAFVIMPFKDKYRDLYDTFIHKFLSEEAKLETKRADEIFGTNPIIQDILENIQKSRLIIAFYTEINPNVLYEIGVAHTLKKDVIILTPDVTRLPFDIRHYRCIQYEDSLLGSEKLRGDLKTTVEEVLAKEY